MSSRLRQPTTGATRRGLGAGAGSGSGVGLPAPEQDRRVVARAGRTPLLGSNGELPLHLPHPCHTTRVSVGASGLARGPATGKACLAYLRECGLRALQNAGGFHKRRYLLARGGVVCHVAVILLLGGG